MKRVIAVLVLVGCSSSREPQEPTRIVIGEAPPAAAEEPVAAEPAAEPAAVSPGAQRARELYDKASEDYNLGRFDEAAQGFQQAYAEYPDAAFLFNIAQADRLAGKCQEAAYFYRAFLRKKPDASDRIKQDVAAHIAAMDACATGSGPVIEE
jgi:TolA-binding protein